MRTSNDTLIVKARRYASDYYRKHKTPYDGHPSHLAVEAIEAAGKKYGIGYGCEGFCWNCGREGIQYLNMGDTYDFTVLFDSRNERFFTGCYGDVVERLQAKGIEIE